MNTKGKLIDNVIHCTNRYNPDNNTIIEEYRLMHDKKIISECLYSREFRDKQDIEPIYVKTITLANLFNFKLGLYMGDKLILTIDKLIMNKNHIEYAIVELESNNIYKMVIIDGVCKQHKYPSKNKSDANSMAIFGWNLWDTDTIDNMFYDHMISITTYTATVSIVDNTYYLAHNTIYAIQRKNNKVLTEGKDKEEPKKEEVSNDIFRINERIICTVIKNTEIDKYEYTLFISTKNRHYPIQEYIPVPIYTYYSHIKDSELFKNTILSRIRTNSNLSEQIIGKYTNYNYSINIYEHTNQLAVSIRQLPIATRINNKQCDNSASDCIKVSLFEFDEHYVFEVLDSGNTYVHDTTNNIKYQVKNIRLPHELYERSID